MKQKLLNNFKLRATLLVAMLCAAFTGAWADDVTDVLNQSLTGITGTSYSSWSGKTSTSDAVYAGQSAGGNSSIQLRSNNNNSGVITTTSGGTVKSISVTWNSNTQSGRTLNVYGKNSAYSAPTDLYNTSTQGDLLGTIVCGTSTELVVSGSYEYIGFRSNGGAMYLDEVRITWTTSGGSAVATTVTIDDSGITNTNVFEGTAAGSLAATVTAGESAVSGAIVTWSGNNDAVATINAGTGAVTLVAAGSVTFTAAYAGVENQYNPSSKTYTMTVTNSDPNAPGTENNPYTVAQARAAIDAGTGITGVYATGIVSKIVTAYNSQYGNISYNISDDGTQESDQLQAYRGFDKDGDWFTSEDDVQVGDVVVIYGNLKKYSSTYEFDSGNQRVSFSRPVPTACATPTFSPAAGTYTSAQSVTISCATDGATIYYTTDGSDPSFADPTAGPAEYTEPILVSADMTIKAVAVMQGLDDSQIATAAYVIDMTPVIDADDIELEYNDTAGEITYTITNELVGYALDATTNADWISDLEVGAGTTPGNGSVTFTATVNEGTTDRTATITLSYASVDKVVTVTQKHYVADYAELPFAFDGGRADIDNANGLTQSGLGSDYSSSPKLKFDHTGDYVILKINEAPGTLTFNIKGNSFSGSTFKVQTSADGETYTDLKTYTELGATQSETFNSLSADVRYIKWIYTEKVTNGGNVALGNIALARFVPTITIDPSVVNVNAVVGDEAITSTITAVGTTGNLQVLYCDDKGDQITKPSWFMAYVHYNDLVYDIADNATSEARTAYLKVYDEAGVYSELITVNQEAYIASITVDPSEVNVNAVVGDEAITSTITSVGTTGDLQVLFCDAEGNQITHPDWFWAYVHYNDLVYDIADNSSTDARTAYLKVYDQAGVYSDLITVNQAAYVAPAAPSNWAVEDLSNLTENNIFVIVGNNGSTYAMANDNGASNAPATVAVTVTGSSLSGDIAANIQWNLGVETDGYIFYPNDDNEKWLYCNNQNNGVRVGTSENKYFTLDSESSYLVNAATSRYVGIYNSQDWRCYTNTTGNIAGQNFTFYKKVEPVTLNANGYATYASTSSLDFTNYKSAGFTAWQVTEINGSTITFEQITSVVAPGTGIFLMGDEPNATANINVSRNEGAALTDNQLVGITAATSVTAGEYYGLKGNQFLNVSAGTIPAGKALLPASNPTAGVKAFTFIFKDADGIQAVQTVNAEAAQAIYNLAGQRLQKAQKGINIINGKKVLVK